jgi:hypothetical protein
MKMTRFKTTLLVIALTAAGTTLASAQTGTSATIDAEASLFAQATLTPEEVVASLIAQGYAVTEQRRTLLGRVMVRAVKDTHTREVVVHPRTGEVLRDVVAELTTSGRTGITAEIARDQRSGVQGGGLLGIGGNIGAEVSGSVSAGAGGGGGGNSGAGIGGGSGVGVGGGVGVGIGGGGVGVGVGAEGGAGIGGGLGRN